MRTFIVLFASGVWLLQREAELPPMHGAWSVLLALPAVAVLRVAKRGVRAAAFVAMGAIACAGGYYWAAAHAHARLTDSLPAQWEGRNILLEGVIASLPQATDRSVRFELEVERVATAGARVPRRIVLSWWARPDALPRLHAGERWRLQVRLKKPHGTINPHGFDYEAWLLERGVRATGYVRFNPAPQRIASLAHHPRHWAAAARERLRERILDALRDAPYAGVIVALAVGDQRAISDPQWQIFTRTGVNHLMSISGLHVTMVSGLAYLLALAAWRASASLTLRLPAQKAAALAAVLAAYLYTLLAGFAVPAQRTFYMVAVVAVALWLALPLPASTVLAAALFVVLVIDPWAVNAAGFWLSFGAVAAILLVSVNRIGRPGWLIAAARVQAAVTIALLPLTLALFQQVSLVSPLANAVAIPIVSLVVVPLVLAGMLLPFDAVLHLGHAAMAACMFLLEIASAAPDAVWQQHAPPAWTVAAAIAGAFWLLLPRGMPGRALGAVACLPLFLVFPAGLRDGELQVAVLDVGQGLAVAVRTANHALVYDTGPAFGPHADSGNRIIAPYLRATGARRLDGLIVSHDDLDHTGGALSLLQALPVAWLATSLADMDPLPLAADEAFLCSAGQRWVWDRVRFEILHPMEALHDAPLKDNDRSCVLKISAPGGSVLIPGDIERRAEATLLERRAALAADVLIAPHQGSRTSSTPAFVDAVRPRIVIFPVGYRNRFGHPHAEVVERYRSAGAALHRTDRDGAVLVSIDPAGTIKVERQRALYRRYWLEAPSTAE